MDAKIITTITKGKIMASRCNSTSNLEVHHKRRDGGNDIGNAEVLCSNCHVNTLTYGTPGKSPAPFTEEIKKQALKNADNKCECRRESCH